MPSNVIEIKVKDFLIGGSLEKVYVKGNRVEILFSPESDVNKRIRAFQKNRGDNLEEQKVMGIIFYHKNIPNGGHLNMIILMSESLFKLHTKFVNIQDYLKFLCEIHESIWPYTIVKTIQ
jgi:hypothetical protein